MTDSSTGGPLLPESAPPLEDFALADVIQSWVSGITGIPGSLVRPRWQPTPPNQPALDTDWCAIGIISESSEDGTPYIQHDGDADTGLGVDRLRRSHELELLATFYGPNASAKAHLLSDGAYIWQNSEVLTAQGIVLVESTEIRRVPEQFQKQWLMRMDVPIRMRRIIDRTYPVRNIVSAPATVTARP